MTEFSVENIYYLGPDGSNAHAAMLKFIKKCSINVKNQKPQKNIRVAIDSLKQDSSSVCVLPIENSIQGIVRETIDNLLKNEDLKIRIQAEISLPIKHLLLANTTDKTEIKKIFSHPQALAQCSNNLYKKYNEVELHDLSSTSYAAEKVAESEDYSVAAIANETCAKMFNLNVLDDDLNDEDDNKTRFYLLGREEIKEKHSKGKTAIILSTKNKSGALCDVLQILKKHDINLTYIDSRPSKRKLGEYLFFMELDGFEHDYKIKIALEELASYVDFIKILGSFCIYE